MAACYGSMIERADVPEGWARCGDGRRARRTKEGTMSRLLRSIAPTVLLVLIAAAAGADVSPGDTINKANADKVKDLVSPGLYWCVQHGWPMKIIETKPITLRKAFTEATEKYSGQVKLTPDGLGLQNYVAGRPFPTIDTNDKFAPI